MRYNNTKSISTIMTDLEDFLTKSRNWAKVIPFLRALCANCDAAAFEVWLRHGNTLNLIELKAQLSDEVMAELYQYRGQDMSDPCPQNNDYMAVDTARCYMVDRGLSFVDDERKWNENWGN